jgi:hypothetical protein
VCDCDCSKLPLPLTSQRYRLSSSSLWFQDCSRDPPDSVCNSVKKGFADLAVATSQLCRTNKRFLLRLDPAGWFLQSSCAGAYQSESTAVERLEFLCSSNNIVSDNRITSIVSAFKPKLERSSSQGIQERWPEGLVSDCRRSACLNSELATDDKCVRMLFY